ncbi:MAG: type I glyceraldehyde-3-phosphate dehydrogenase [Myxococcota bacterium]|jgi:glyceraldehyde 3-phosphate dehydrogenase|nr:type I glyceraldehyde-3-phosphate dehydrogenase [Myxococcota bacterium]
MAVRIGINGFGRIGRTVLRAGINNPEIEFVGINDLTDANTLAYMLKYDSVHGVFPGEVRAEGENLVVNGKSIPVSAQKDPAAIGWGTLKAEMVLECTGKFLAADKAKAHIAGGAKWVFLSAPGKGDEDITVVYGVNHTLLDPEKHRIISNASCTTNCLAPMAKVLHDNFNVQHGLMTTIHAYTNDQVILDQPHSKDWRRGRAGAMSMIPTSTGAAKAVGLVLPDLKGKLDGLAIRVPTPNVSMTDLTATLEKPATAAEINELMKAASEGPLKGILRYSDEKLVSIDLNGDPHSVIFVADQTRSFGNLVKVLGWYDNETGYSHRMLDVISYMAKKAQ